VRGTTDAHGRATGSRSYDAWGIPVQGSIFDTDEHGDHQVDTDSGRASLMQLFGFDGERLDPRTGLVHLRARWYQPGSGRMLGRDPFAGSARRPVSQHAYQFAFNNPLRYGDPSGRIAALLNSPSGAYAVDGRSLYSDPSSLWRRPDSDADQHAATIGFPEPIGGPGQAPSNCIVVWTAAGLKCIDLPSVPVRATPTPPPTSTPQPEPMATPAPTPVKRPLPNCPDTADTPFNVLIQGKDLMVRTPATDSGSNVCHVNADLSGGYQFNNWHLFWTDAGFWGFAMRLGKVDYNTPITYGPDELTALRRASARGWH
jgi:RHS repeat-associated protein